MGLQCRRCVDHTRSFLLTTHVSIGSLLPLSCISMVFGTPTVPRVLHSCLMQLFSFVPQTGKHLLVVAELLAAHPTETPTTPTPGTSSRQWDSSGVQLMSITWQDKKIAFQLFCVVPFTHHTQKESKESNWLAEEGRSSLFKSCTSTRSVFVVYRKVVSVLFGSSLKILSRSIPSISTA